MKNILITGGCGFVGIHLFSYLKRCGYKPVIVDSADKVKRLRYFDSSLDFIQCELGKGKLQMPSDIDLVIHLAALPHVDYSYYHPKCTIENNIGALLEVLDAIVKKDIPVILASSVEIYSSEQDTNYTEDCIPLPVSAYGVSKYSCELILQSYARCYGISYNIFRLTNLYGEYQLPDRIIPRSICRLLTGIDIEVDNDVKRDFLYVGDACSAIEKIVTSPQYGQIYNISTGKNTSMVDVCNMIASVIQTGKVKINIKSFAGKQRCRNLMIGNSKIVSKFNWQPKVDLQSGVIQTIKWYKDNVDWYHQFIDCFTSSRDTSRFIVDTQFVK